jgi:hypothetical protein
MSRFDELAGLSEGSTLERTPLKTIDEFGGGATSTTSADTDYGEKPPATKLGSPNSAYRPPTKPEIGKGQVFTVKKRQIRTGTPAASRQVTTTRKEDEDSRFDELAGLNG